MSATSRTAGASRRSNAKTTTARDVELSGASKRAYHPRAWTSSHTCRAKIGAAINTKIGMCRTDLSAANPVTNTRNTSLKRARFGDNASAPSNKKRNKANGRNIALWKSGDAHSSMNAAIDGERRVSNGYENMRNPFGLSGTTVTHVTATAANPGIKFHLRSNTRAIA